MHKLDILYKSLGPQPLNENWVGDYIKLSLLKKRGLDETYDDVCQKLQECEQTGESWKSMFNLNKLRQ